MRFCEECGREIPEGARLCGQCQAAEQVRGTEKNLAGRDGAEQPARAGRDDRPAPAGNAPGKAAAAAHRGRMTMIVMSALLAAFLLFFAAALLLGSRGGTPQGAEDSAPTLERWQGGGDDAPAAEPGPDSLQLTAPDAQQVLENTPPDPLAGHSYQVVVEDATWQEAYDRAAAAGGYLATITSQAEYEAVCAAADQAAAETGVRYLWLGARLGSGGWSGADCWITGEDWSFSAWYPGEPSGQDEDGTQEDVLCMWNVEGSGWTFNDQRGDLIAALPSVSGAVGYVIEFEG